MRICCSDCQPNNPRLWIELLSLDVVWMKLFPSKSPALAKSPWGLKAHSNAWRSLTQDCCFVPCVWRIIPVCAFGALKLTRRLGQCRVCWWIFWKRAFDGRSKSECPLSLQFDVRSGLMLNAESVSTVLWKAFLCPPTGRCAITYFIYRYQGCNNTHIRTDIFHIDTLSVLSCPDVLSLGPQWN